MRKFWIVNKVNPGTAELLVYGEIGYEVDAAGFTNELRELAKEYANINIRINSCGGSVFDGFAIYNAIKNCHAVIDTYIDGICASMATPIALAGRRVYMSKVATWMTHRAATIACGNAADLRTTAEMVETVENSICSIYAQKTGLTLDQAKEKYMTGEDRWLSPQQCVDERLIDGIYDAEAVEVPDNASASIRQGIYNKVLQPQTPTNNMAKIILSLSAMTVLGLTAAADGIDATVVENKIAELAAKAAKADSLATEKTNAENELAALKGTTAKARVTAILDKALADKKTTVALNAKLEKLYADNPDGLQDLVDEMPAYQSIVENLTAHNNTALPEKYKGKTYDELHNSGDLADLKVNHQDAYKEVYKAKFGKEPQA